jgi:hypothetical protein
MICTVAPLYTGTGSTQAQEVIYGAQDTEIWQRFRGAAARR